MPVDPAVRAALGRARALTRDGQVEAALGRALVCVARLDVARGARDVEAAVAGVRHELRTALLAFGLDPDSVLAQARGDGSLTDDTPPPVEDDTRVALPFDRPG